MKITHSQQSLHESAERRYGDAQGRVHRALQLRKLKSKLLVRGMCALILGFILILLRLFARQ